MHYCYAAVVGQRTLLRQREEFCQRIAVHQDTAVAATSTFHTPCPTQHVAVPTFEDQCLYLRADIHTRLWTDKVSPGYPQGALVLPHRKGRLVPHHDCGFHQGLTPSVHFDFHRSLSASLHFRVDCWTFLPANAAPPLWTPRKAPQARNSWRSPRPHTKRDFNFRLCLSTLLHVGVECWVLTAPGGEGVELKGQDPWDFDTWEVWFFVWRHQRYLCRHLVHPGRRMSEFYLKYFGTRYIHGFRSGSSH